MNQITNFVSVHYSIHFASLAVVRFNKLFAVFVCFIWSLLFPISFFLLKFRTRVTIKFIKKLLFQCTCLYFKLQILNLYLVLVEIYLPKFLLMATFLLSSGYFEYIIFFHYFENIIWVKKFFYIANVSKLLPLPGFHQ